MRISRLISFSSSKIVDNNGDNRRLYKSKVEFVIDLSYAIEIIS